MRSMILAAALLAAGPAGAQPFRDGPTVHPFINYSMWEGLPEDARATYIMGAIDSLLAVANGADGLAIALHYDSCLQRAGMTSVQIAGNLRAFVATRPKLQAGLVQRALVEYLEALCEPEPKAPVGRPPEIGLRENPIYQPMTLPQAGIDKKLGAQIATGIATGLLSTGRSSTTPTDTAPSKSPNETTLEGLA